jgi:hypothetical protein
VTTLIRGGPPTPVSTCIRRIGSYLRGMARFANAAPALGGELGWPAFPWLAGLLEGEGTFLKPPPSGPRSPTISCRMTDLDVVELVAALFGTSVQANDKGRYQTEFATMIRGSRAVELMRLLRPMMSTRRQSAIDRAVEGYTSPTYKLSFELAESIRDRYSDGETVSALARGFGVSRPTIRAILKGDIYPLPERFPWIPISCVKRGATAAGTGLNWKELYWLAGWLEAEGSFCRPPPSSPRSPRIHGGSTDRDAIGEVARLLRVKPRLERPRRSHWSDYWHLYVNAGRAITLMQAIAPAMGKRRTAQINAAILAASSAGATLGWHERHARGAQERERRRRFMEAARFERACSVTNDRLLQV